MRHSTTMRRGAGLALVGAAALAPAASAATVSAPQAQARACHARLAPAGARGVDVTRVTAKVDGLVQARLSGAGDWDLGVFDARTGRSVAGSAGFASNELAEGFVSKGQALVVQACRYRGDAGSASLRVGFDAVKTGEDGERTQVVEVRTPTRAAKARLAELGLDLTEHGRRGSLEVVLHGKRDARVLRANGFDYDVEIADLAAPLAANRRADREYAARVVASDLPSGRDTYRRLPDYELELKELALQYPSLVRPLVLPNKSVLGRDVNAIEITANAAAVDDGKPIFLNMGVHHAREWPVVRARHGVRLRPPAQLRRRRARDPPRGRHADDRAAHRQPRRLQPLPRGLAPPGHRAVRPVRLRDEAQELRHLGDHAGGAPHGHLRGQPRRRLRGTDLNRNYGGLWGGSGASTLWFSDTFRGDGPFSEPEVQNVRRLQSTRPITNLITNHTYSNLVLRPPGVAAFGFPLDEPEYERARRRAGGPQRLREPAGLPALRHDGRHRGLDVLDRRLARLHVRDRPATSSIRRTRRASSPSTSAAPPPRAPAWAATARPTTRCSRPRRTRPCTPASAARWLPARGSPSARRS